MLSKKPNKTRARQDKNAPQEKEEWWGERRMNEGVRDSMNQEDVKAALGRSARAPPTLPPPLALQRGRLHRAYTMSDRKYGGGSHISLPSLSGAILALFRRRGGNFVPKSFREINSFY